MQRQQADSSEPLLPVRGTVLQAAVSDREYLVWQHQEVLDHTASKARAMVASGQGDEICCR